MTLVITRLYETANLFNLSFGRSEAREEPAINPKSRFLAVLGMIISKNVPGPRPSNGHSVTD